MSTRENLTQYGLSSCKQPPLVSFWEGLTYLGTRLSIALKMLHTLH